MYKKKTKKNRKSISLCCLPKCCHVLHKAKFYFVMHTLNLLICSLHALVLFNTHIPLIVIQIAKILQNKLLQSEPNFMPWINLYFLACVNISKLSEIHPGFSVICVISKSGSLPESGLVTRFSPATDTHKKKRTGTFPHNVTTSKSLDEIDVRETFPVLHFWVTAKQQMTWGAESAQGVKVSIRSALMILMFISMLWFVRFGWVSANVSPFYFIFF